jgi:catechol 2,3-dioxygenase-like lactoylglutathione lyase family enzyme
MGIPNRHRCVVRVADNSKDLALDAPELLRIVMDVHSAELLSGFGVGLISVGINISTYLSTTPGAKRRSNMRVELNHIIVPARDRWASARFLADILGLEAAPEWAHFVPVRTANGVTLDFADSKDFRHLHCAFLVSETDFDSAMSRIKSAGVNFYAEFDGTGHSEINRLYDGRGVYFDDPNGHMFELITRPYGTRPERWIRGAAIKFYGLRVRRPYNNEESKNVRLAMRSEVCVAACSHPRARFQSASLWHRVQIAVKGGDLGICEVREMVHRHLAH